MKLREKMILLNTMLLLLFGSTQRVIAFEGRVEGFDPKAYLEESKEFFEQKSIEIQKLEQEKLTVEEKENISSLDTKNKDLYKKIEEYEEYYGPYEEAQQILEDPAATDAAKEQAQQDSATAETNIQQNADQIEQLRKDIQTGLKVLEAKQAELGVRGEAPAAPEGEGEALVPEEDGGVAVEPAEEKGGDGKEPEEKKEDPIIAALVEGFIEIMQSLFFSQWFSGMYLSLPEFAYKLYKLLTGDIEIDWSPLKPDFPSEEFQPPVDGTTLEVADALTLFYQLQQIKGWIGSVVASAFESGKKLSKSDSAWMKRYSQLLDKIEILDVRVLIDIGDPQILPQSSQKQFVQTIINAVKKQPVLSWLAVNDKSMQFTGLPVLSSISEYDLVKAMRAMQRLEGAFLYQVYTALQAPSGLPSDAQTALQDLADLLMTLSSKIDRNDPTVLSHLNTIDQRMLLLNAGGSQPAPPITAALA